MTSLFEYHLNKQVFSLLLTNVCNGIMRNRLRFFSFFQPKYRLTNGANGGNQLNISVAHKKTCIQFFIINSYFTSIYVYI